MTVKPDRVQAEMPLHKGYENKTENFVPCPQSERKGQRVIETDYGIPTVGSGCLIVSPR